MAASNNILAENDNRHLYAVLNLPRNADVDQIQRNFKLLSRVYHPDKAPIEKRDAANRTFVVIKNAAEILSDPVFRLAYDRGGMLAVSLIKRTQTAAQSQKIRGNDKNGNGNNTDDVYTALQKAGTEQEAIKIIDELIESYRIQQDEISVEQFDASCALPYVYRQDRSLEREAATVRFQTRHQLSHTTGASFSATSELQRTAEANIGLSTGFDFQPVAGTQVNADVALNHRIPYPVVSVRTSRRSVAGTVMTASIGGTPYSRKSWDVSLSSIRSLFFWGNSSNNNGSPSEATRLQASWTVAFKPTGMLRGLIASLRTVQYPIWRCRFSLSGYPFKVSWRGAETDTFSAAFSLAHTSACRFKLMRSSSIGKSWRIKYGLKYDGLALYSGGSVWNILCRFESDHLSLRIPVSLQAMSPVSWLVTLLVAEFVDQHLQLFKESTSRAKEEIDFESEEKKPLSSLLVPPSRQFLDVVRQVASKKRKFVASRDDGGLLIIKADWQSGKEHHDWTDLLQFWVVDSGLNIPMNDARWWWQQEKQGIDTEISTSWWRYLFGSKERPVEKATGLLRVRYQFKDVVYEIVFKSGDVVQIPNTLATELGRADLVL